MARAIWSGAISFGLVSVPVKAYTAVRDHSVHFHRIEKETGARVRNQRVSDETGEEVDADDVEMGYELTKGHYVTFDPKEIDELRPTSTRSIDVSDFVPLADIDPIYYERTYWLAPDGDGAARPYALLLAAMEDAERVGIGSVVMRTKQYLTAVRPLDGALAMSTMRFADDIVARSDVDAIPAKRAKADAKEKKLAGQIIDALATDWDPERYHDTFTEEVKELIEQRAKGEELTVEPGVEEDSGNVLDLMEALKASVEAQGKRRGSTKASSRGKSSSRTGSAKKATKKKASGTRKASSRKGAAKKSSARKPAKKSAARKAS